MSQCFYCHKSHPQLTKLPFGKQICNECVDLKCSIKSDSSTNWQREINPVEFLTEIDPNKPRNRFKETRADKIARIQSKLAEFQTDLVNYSSRVRETVDVTRYQVEVRFELAKSSVETSLSTKLKWIDSEIDESARKHSETSALVLSRVDEMLSSLKKSEFSDEMKIRRELFNCQMRLFQGRFVEVSPIRPLRATLGLIKYLSQVILKFIYNYLILNLFRQCEIIYQI